MGGQGVKTESTGRWVDGGRREMGGGEGDWVRKKERGRGSTREG